ncbi:MAG: 50S ribosome-binding GTPase [Myxococcales bacterium]|nr:50S ribosome-binding GTPase [Myxococcales bacterium]
MREHTFTATRMDTALAQVKRELGTGATILSSRRRADGVIEIRAAIAGEEDASAAPRESLLERILERGGLSPELARTIGARAPWAPRTLGEVPAAVADALAPQIDFRAPDLRNDRLVLALVGPTGVGKTTTLAKLAAEAALVHGRAAAIVSLDGYRIGATEQAERFADLIGIPLLVARDAESFSLALRRLADADIVFVDTPGRSPREHAAQTALAEILQKQSLEVTVTLCIAAATRDEELEQHLAVHAALRPSSITVTKVDEALRHDAAIRAPFATGLPLAWLSDGQRVPEDLDVATPERLAALLCGTEEGE